MTNETPPAARASADDPRASMEQSRNEDVAQAAPPTASTTDERRESFEAVLRASQELLRHEEDAHNAYEETQAQVPVPGATTAGTPGAIPPIGVDGAPAGALARTVSRRSVVTSVNEKAASSADPVSTAVAKKEEEKKEPETMMQKIMSFLPDRNTIKNTGGWFRLLLRTDPEPLDYLLILLGTIFGLAAGVPFPMIGILFGQLVDDMNSSTCDAESDPSSMEGGVNKKVLMVLYVTIANFFCIYIHSSCWSMVGERLVRRLREKYFNALLRQEVSYFDTLPSGEVSSRLSGDLEIIQTGTSEKVGIVLSSVSYFVTSYIVAFIKDAKLAGMLFSMVPAFFLMAMVGAKYVGKYTGAMTNHIAAATSIASEALSNMTIVHAFGANERLENLFAGHLMKAQKEGIKKAFAAALQLGTLYFIAYSGNALAFWQGSYHIAESVNTPGSGTTVGAVYTVIFLLLDASFILSQVAPFLAIFGGAAGAAEKLLETINRTSAIDGTSLDEGDFLDPVVGELAFRNVKFSYPSRPDVEVLHGINLTIPAQKHTALVGLSGSGKSTIGSLLLRLYDPTEGMVTLDGRDIRTLNVRHVRGSIGLVQQEPTLFDRSILENIAHGLVNSDAHIHLRPLLLGSALSDIAKDVCKGSNINDAVKRHGPEAEELFQLVLKASEIADARTFIEKLAHGFATSVGSAGSQLSGGQKQRIAVARALVCQPKVLLLDEATAALDSVSERTIQKALEQAAEGRTTISIAHRLATIKNADNIVCMSKGNIVEQGTHAELIAKDGAYANLVRLQTVGASEDKDKQESISRSSTVVEGGHEKPDAPVSEKKDLFLERITSSSKTPATSPAASEKEQDEKKRRFPFLHKKKKEEDNSAGYNKPRLGIRGTVAGIATLCRRQWIFVLLGMTASVVVGGAYAGEAVIFGQTIGALSPCRTPAAIRDSGEFWGLLFFVLALAEVTANVVNGSSFGYVAEKLLYRVRIQALRTLLWKDIQWHESEGRTPATLLSYISQDASSLGALTGTIIGILCAILVNLFAGIIMSHIIAWKIAVVLLACIPLLLGSGFMRLRVLGQFAERHQKAFAQSVAITVEAVSSIKTIATLSLEHESLETYKRSLRVPYEATLRAIATGNLWLAAAYSISNLIYALAYWWGFQQIMDGLYSQTQFFIVLPALLFSAQACGQMFSLAPDLIKSRQAAGNILHLMGSGGPADMTIAEDHPLADPEKSFPSTSSSSASEKPYLPPTSGIPVEFRNVNFSYPSRPTHPVLRDFNLKIPAGAFCALVGQSGSGKSTTISLIERFYRPSSGQILVNGVDITATDSIEFRNDIALVPQEPVLFAGTVRFNLSLGAPPGREPSLDEIITAAKAANIHDTIMALPDGYDTLCGNNGSQFSGGQRQRMAIARALLRQPRLLLLDESTSALDAESERLLQESLERVASKITVVAIAHRIYTIRKAKVIFLIRDGQCVDQGTHEELCERDESYRVNAMHQVLDV